MTNPPVALVVLPGLDGTDVFLRPFLSLLPDHIRPIVVCYPPKGDNRYETLLKLARRTVADLPEFYIFGSSFGGPLAIMLAAAEPQKTRGLILSATFLQSPQERFRRFRFAAVAPVVWALRTARRVPVWMRRKADALRMAKAETWRRTSARCLAARVRAVLRVDVRETLRACRAPVLCLSFAQDQTVPRNCAEEILRHCPTAGMVTLPGRHLAVFSDPEPSAREVARFIQEEEAGRFARCSLGGGASNL